MTKKNLGVEATFRVLGRELTRAEANELYLALQTALNIQPYYKYTPQWPVPWRPVPYQPWWVSTDPVFYGDGTHTTCSGNGVTDATYISNVVEVYDNEPQPVGM
jgi:hypothetical protein